MHCFPLLARGVAFHIAQREFDETRIRKCGVDRVDRLVEYDRDATGGHREGVLEIEQGFDRVGPHRAGQHRQPLAIQFAGPPVAAAQRIEHHAAAQCTAAGFIANHEAVAGQRHHRILHYQLHQTAAAVLNCRGRFEYDRASERFAGAQEQADPRVGFKRAAGGGPNLQAHVQARGLEIQPLVGQPRSPFDRDTLRPGQIKRDPLAQPGLLHGLAVHLDPAHPDLAAAGQDAQLLAGAHLGAQCRTCHHRAMTLDDEGAIHRQPEQPGCAAGLKAAELAGNLGPQLFNSGPGRRGDRDDRRGFKRGAFGEQADFVADFSDRARG